MKSPVPPKGSSSSLGGVAGRGGTDPLDCKTEGFAPPAGACVGLVGSGDAGLTPPAVGVGVALGADIPVGMGGGGPI